MSNNINNVEKLTNYIFSCATWFNSANTVYINSHGTGESDDVSVLRNTAYPRLFIEQPFEVYYTNNTVEYVIQLLIMDKHKGSEIDLMAKQNLTFQILNILIEKFKQDRNYQISPEISLASHSQYND